MLYFDSLGVGSRKIRRKERHRDDRRDNIGRKTRISIV
jgi:hypothetical protein